MKSCIIIGKGPSLSKADLNYIDSHDEIIICNFLKFKGYESLLPARANIQFRGKGAKNYSYEEFNKLGISIVIGIQPEQYDFPFESHYNIAKLYHVNYPIVKNIEGRNAFLSEVNGHFLNDPSCGTIAFDWACKSGRYNRISICGFDLFRKNTEAYYWNLNEWPENLKYLKDEPGHVYNNNGVIVKEHAHNEKNNAFYIYKLMETYNNIKFDVTSNNPLLNKMVDNLSNVRKTYVS